MSSFELGCCPGFIWTLVTTLHLLQIVMTLSSSRNLTSWHWSKICKKKPKQWVILWHLAEMHP